MTAHRKAVFGLTCDILVSQAHAHASAKPIALDQVNER